MAQGLRSKLHLLPIEPIPMRYSIDWTRWMKKGFEAEGYEVNVVHDDEWVRHTEIHTGQFLDCFETNRYKSLQLIRTLELLETGEISEGDVVFFMDGWNPAVFQLAYARDVSRKLFKLAGYFHAGTWDPNDLLTQRGLHVWAREMEASLFKVFDFAFVATPYHASLIRKVGGVPHVVGAPIDCQEMKAKDVLEKSCQVVFPHRWAPEKNPEAWLKLIEIYRTTYLSDSSVRFVSTMGPSDPKITKEEFYKILSQSMVAVSTAFQETFGIAMVEAALLGCTVLVPDRLSYRDVFSERSRYSSLESAAEMIHEIMTKDYNYYEAPNRVFCDVRMACSAMTCAMR